MSSATWFEVDKGGLAKLMAGKNKAFLLYELLQNAWDQNVTQVDVTVEKIEHLRCTVRIQVVDDDPDGFTDLAHAYTLFAESAKKADAGKRGRFNMGEKLVLAVAREARIVTTKGTVEFDEAGRHEKRLKRDKGSCVTALFNMTKADFEQVLKAADRVIVPPGISTRVNGRELPQRQPIAEFETVLPTLVADDDGVLRPSQRKTIVRVYETDGETAWLHEMGIPVVQTGDRYHVDVQQKVPLNMDRDNVTPAYLRAIRVAVLNATFERITKEDAAQTWVKEACGDERVADEAVRKTIGLRFGDNAVAYDASDVEGSKLSMSQGRQVVYGGHLSAAEWEMAKRAGVLPAAGTITPSPKPYSPDGPPLNVIPYKDWTAGMKRFQGFAIEIAQLLLDAKISVRFANQPDWNVLATYGISRELTFNVARTTPDYFDGQIKQQQIDDLIHEFGHHYSGDHLSSEYHDALTRLGAKFTLLALRRPELFK